VWGFAASERGPEWRIEHEGIAELLHGRDVGPVFRSLRSPDHQQAYLPASTSAFHPVPSAAASYWPQTKERHAWMREHWDEAKGIAAASRTKKMLFDR